MGNRDVHRSLIDNAYGPSLCPLVDPFKGTLIQFLWPLHEPHNIPITEALVPILEIPIMEPG